MAFSWMAAWPAGPARTRQAGPPGRARGRGRIASLRRAGRGGYNYRRVPPAAARCPAGGQTSPACSASRVRSARRRQPVLSRIRSRWVCTVRTLMYSWAAIWASVRPRATRVTSSRSRALSLPGPGAAPGRGRPGAVSSRAYSAAVASSSHHRTSAASAACCSRSTATRWRIARPGWGVHTVVGPDLCRYQPGPAGAVFPWL